MVIIFMRGFTYFPLLFLVITSGCATSNTPSPSSTGNQQKEYRIGDVTLDTDCVEYAKNKKIAYGLIGAIGGAIIGSKLGKGDKNEKAIGGAVAGAMAGILAAEKAAKGCMRKVAALNSQYREDLEQERGELQQKLDSASSQEEKQRSSEEILSLDQRETDAIDNENKSKERTQQYLESLAKEKKKIKNI